MFKLVFERIFFIIKKFILCTLIIYAYNIIVYPTFNIIPMNYFSILIILIFGFPGVIALSLFCIFIL